MSINPDMLLLLKSAGIGDGEPDLGTKLIGSFLSMLLESGDIPAKIICLNSGIFLTTENSPVQKQLDEFVAAGTEILSCGTCLDYYGRRDKLIAGRATTMRETVAAMLSHGKILAP